MLGEVLASWRQDNVSEVEPRWFWALAEQMEAALGGKVHSGGNGHLSARRSDVRMCRTSRRRVELDGVHFDVYLVPFAPRPVPIRDKMLTIDQMYFKDQSAGPLAGVLLMDLVKEMDGRNAILHPLAEHADVVPVA